MRKNQEGWVERLRPTGATPLSEYLQKAAGQLACARDSARELVPCPIEMVNRLDSMVKECVRLKEQELSDYEARNGRQP